MNNRFLERKKERKRWKLKNGVGISSLVGA
jgi:hypothetical protein